MRVTRTEAHIHRDRITGVDTGKSSKARFCSRSKHFYWAIHQKSTCELTEQFASRFARTGRFARKLEKVPNETKQICIGSRYIFKRKDPFLESLRFRNHPRNTETSAFKWHVWPFITCPTLSSEPCKLRRTYPRLHLWSPESPEYCGMNTCPRLICFKVNGPLICLLIRCNVCHSYGK